MSKDKLCEMNRDVYHRYEFGQVDNLHQFMQQCLCLSILHILFDLDCHNLRKPEVRAVYTACGTVEMKRHRKSNATAEQSITVQMQ
jgi:hypothetical protein